MICLHSDVAGRAMSYTYMNCQNLRKRGKNAVSSPELYTYLKKLRCCHITAENLHTFWLITIVKQASTSLDVSRPWSRWPTALLMDSRAVRRDESDSSDPVPNDGPFLNQAIWCLTAIPAMFLALRVYCKIWRKRSLWWDDYILIVSWVRYQSNCYVVCLSFPAKTCCYTGCATFVDNHFVSRHELRHRTAIR